MSRLIVLLILAAIAGCGVANGMLSKRQAHRAVLALRPDIREQDNTDWFEGSARLMHRKGVRRWACLPRYIAERKPGARGYVCREL